MNGAVCGAVTAHTWSPRLKQNIGLALIDRTAVVGDKVSITLPDGIETSGTLCDLPFI